ncbi:MAG TPA: 1-(5-phosphoribosyl)-5-[(5-phosphoribosylamino)methylideneamino]imidazole-4-carboxamide isomerase [Ruminococcaceae bacterium]|nr:1-(5-phosphoribosyl)-5-[(5-phosphoribosylamino)methylideneamino]imidazole-4-carboxamide isomerase [Oscillospiraceae bacterium]
MVILPAIDIKDGDCVRLYKGAFDTVERVAEDYMETARGFEAAGAEWLHMVDLDGALYGEPRNKEIFIETAAGTALRVEVGGGIRDMKTAEEYLSAGIARVILGSAAVNSPEFVKEALKEYGGRVAIGIDAKDEMVMAQGWISDSKIHYIELAKRMRELGAEYIIYTDISKDGTLAGPNTAQLEALSGAVDCDIIASGGIKEIGDIKALKALGVYGAICGKSIYKGTLDLKKAIETAEG